VLSLGCSYICFAIGSEVLEDQVFAPDKSLARKIVSEMTCNVSRGTLNRTVSTPLPRKQNLNLCMSEGCIKIHGVFVALHVCV